VVIPPARAPVHFISEETVAAVLAAVAAPPAVVPTPTPTAPNVTKQVTAVVPFTPAPPAPLAPSTPTAAEVSKPVAPVRASEAPSLYTAPIYMPLPCEDNSELDPQAKARVLLFLFCILFMFWVAICVKEQLPTYN